MPNSLSTKTGMDGPKAATKQWGTSNVALKKLCSYFVKFNETS